MACMDVVDSHMCKEAVAHKIELVKQLGVVLQGTVKPSECAPFSRTVSIPFSPFPPVLLSEQKSRNHSTDHARGEAVLQ